MKTALRPAADWHDVHGSVLWWRVPINEPPFVGSPLGDDWREDYYTHWCPLPDVADPTRDPPPPPFAITLAPTKQVAVIETNGGEKVLARIWRGSFKGHEVQVLVTGIGLDVEAPKAVHEEWERELVALVGGPVAWIPNDSAADDVDVKAPAFDHDLIADLAAAAERRTDESLGAPGRSRQILTSKIEVRDGRWWCLGHDGPVTHILDSNPPKCGDCFDWLVKRNRHAAEVHEAVRKAAREGGDPFAAVGVTDDVGPGADLGITHALQEARCNETCGHCGRTITTGRYMYVDVRPESVLRHITCPRCEALETAVDQMNGVIRRHAGLDGHRTLMIGGIEVIVDDEMQPNEAPIVIDLSKARRPQ